MVCQLQIRKRDGVKHPDDTKLKFQAADVNDQRENLEGIEQQQQPPVHHMVCYITKPITGHFTTYLYEYKERITLSNFSSTEQKTAFSLHCLV